MHFARLGRAKRNKHTFSLYTLETHVRSLQKWACIFPIFHAVVLLDSSSLISCLSVFTVPGGLIRCACAALACGPHILTLQNCTSTSSVAFLSFVCQYTFFFKEQCRMVLVVNFSYF